MSPGNTPQLEEMDLVMGPGQEMAMIHSNKQSNNCHHRSHRCLGLPNCNRNRNHHAPNTESLLRY
jgi:hypothetical protein